MGELLAVAPEQRDTGPGRTAACETGRRTVLGEPHGDPVARRDDLVGGDDQPGVAVELGQRRGHVLIARSQQVAADQQRVVRRQDLLTDLRVPPVQPVDAPAPDQRGRRRRAARAGRAGRASHGRGAAGTRRRPVRLAEVLLEHLARGVARQLRHDVHRRRALVACQPGAREGDDLLLGGCRTGTQHDHRLDRLAPPLRRHGDDGDVGDRRVIGEDALDLGGVDVLPTRYDHVFEAVAQEDVALFVAVRGVARPQPAAVDQGRGSRLRLVPVAHHVLGAADPDLPHRVGGQRRRRRGVTDLDLDPREGTADRAHQAGPRACGVVRLRRQVQHGPRRLGHPVDTQEPAAQPLHGPQHQELAHRGPAVADQLQARQVGAGRPRGVEHGSEDRRYPEGMRHTVPLDLRQQPGRVGLPRDHGVPALTESGQAVAGTTDVEQRRGDQVDATFAHAPRGLRHVGCGQQVRTRDAGALRQPRRPRAVELKYDVVRGHVVPRVGGVRSL